MRRPRRGRYAGCARGWRAGGDAAVLLVDLLTGNDVGEDRSVPADRAARFVAGGFDGQDGHGLAHSAQN